MLSTPNQYVLITFNSSHQAIAAEQLLEQKNILSRLIPLPPEIDAGCGLVLRAPFKKKVIVCKTLENAHIDIQKIYMLEYTAKNKKNIHAITI